MEWVVLQQYCSLNILQWRSSTFLWHLVKQSILEALMAPFMGFQAAHLFRPPCIWLMIFFHSACLFWPAYYIISFRIPGNLCIYLFVCLSIVCTCIQHIMLYNTCTFKKIEMDMFLKPPSANYVPPPSAYKAKGVQVPLFLWANIEKYPL